MSNSYRARAGSLLCVPLAASAAGIAAFALPAKAADVDAGGGSFEVQSDVRAIAATVRDNSLPVTQTVDVALFGAAAQLSSTGLAKADAGAPYSPFGYSLPSTVTGVGAGELPPIPPFPGYVSSAYPETPSAVQRTGGYELSATTSETAARGEVGLGARPAGSPNSNGFASAEAVSDGAGGVVASGIGGVSGLTFGDAFEFGRIASSLELRVPASGAPVVTGTTDLGTVTVSDSFVSGLRNGGGLVAGQSIPVTPDVISSLNEGLKPIGIAIAYLPPSYGYADGSYSAGPKPESNKLLRSVVSGGLQLTFSRDVPTQGPVVSQYSVGRISLSASTNGTSSSVSGALPAVPGAVGTGAAPTGVDAAGAGLGESAVGAVPTLPNTAADAAVPTVSLVPQAAGPDGVAVHGVAFGGQLSTSTKSFYLVLALCGLAALAGAQLTRFLAVKR